MRGMLVLTVLSLLGAAPSAASETALLRGSTLSMVRQNRVAREHGLSFLLTPAQVRDAASRGDLVELLGSEDYEVAPFVSYPYVVPPVRAFVERFSADYRAACGQKLVVTSAVRPVSEQPRNAHELSVHPAGMAVDVRVSDSPSCRRWIEGQLVALGEEGVLNGIRERRPPHYHIAVYPMPYVAYLEAQRAEDRASQAAALLARGEDAPPLAGEAPRPTPTSRAAAGEPSGVGRRLVPLSITTLMALVGGGLVLGVRPVTATSWWSGARGRLADRIRRFLSGGR